MLDGEKLSEIIDLQRYPIDQLGSDRAQALIEEWHGEFKEKGVCVLEGFVQKPALEQMVEQARNIENLAFHNSVTGNAYLTDTNSELAADHPVNMTEETRLGAIAYDQIPKKDLIRQVYESDLVMKFIENVARLGPVYRYACPLGGLNIAVMEDDEYLRWHFDQSEFVVSIPLQEANQGGEFEYAHGIRSSTEPCYDDVRSLLLGDRKNVSVLRAQPGSLILFQGMNTIHRVTKIEGSVNRLGALLGYADRPDVNSSDYLKKIRYGRVQ